MCLTRSWSNTILLSYCVLHKALQTTYEYSQVYLKTFLVGMIERNKVILEIIPVGCTFKETIGKLSFENSCIFALCRCDSYLIDYLNNSN